MTAARIVPNALVFLWAVTFVVWTANGTASTCDDGYRALGYFTVQIFLYFCGRSFIRFCCNKVIARLKPAPAGELPGSVAKPKTSWSRRIESFLLILWALAVIAVTSVGVIATSCGNPYRAIFGMAVYAAVFYIGWGILHLVFVGIGRLTGNKPGTTAAAEAIPAAPPAEG